MGGAAGSHWAAPSGVAFPWRALSIRNAVTVAQVTTKARGIPVEVALAPEDGLPEACVVHLHTMATVRKHLLTEHTILTEPTE